MDQIYVVLLTRHPLPARRSASPAFAMAGGIYIGPDLMAEWQEIFHHLSCRHAVTCHSGEPLDAEGTRWRGRLPFFTRPC